MKTITVSHREVTEIFAKNGFENPEQEADIFFGTYAAINKAKNDINFIISEACSKYGITREYILSYSRRRLVAEARQYAMYMIKKRTGLTNKKIGLIFRKDPSTVSHASSLIEWRIKHDCLLCK